VSKSALTDRQLVTSPTPVSKARLSHRFVHRNLPGSTPRIRAVLSTLKAVSFFLPPQRPIMYGMSHTWHSALRRHPALRSHSAQQWNATQRGQATQRRHVPQPVEPVIPIRSVILPGMARLVGKQFLRDTTGERCTGRFNSGIGHSRIDVQPRKTPLGRGKEGSVSNPTLYPSAYSKGSFILLERRLAMPKARGHEIRLLTGKEMDVGHWKRTYKIGGYCATKGCKEHPRFSQSFVYKRASKWIQVRSRECCFKHAAVFAVANGLRVPAVTTTSTAQKVQCICEDRDAVLDAQLTGFTTPMTTTKCI